MPATSLVRLIDAALNRAGEGLRVVEDYVRFVRDDPLLMQLAKDVRHALAAAGRIDSTERHAARNTRSDVGTDIRAAEELARGDAWDVCAASFKRVEQALRSLEEYAKLIDPAWSPQFAALRYQTYTLEKLTDTARDSAERLADVRLMVLISGDEGLAKLADLVTLLVEAGAGAIQLRAKQCEDRALVAQARRLRELTRGTQTLAIINDRPDIAALSDADGVHLGQDDLSVKDARTIVGPRMLVGVSTHSIDQARAAVLDGANYLGAGPTFPSATKRFDTLAGLDYLRELAAEIRLPTFAIGGINRENVEKVREAGLDRVAVSSAIARAADPGRATGELLAALDCQTAPQSS